MSQRVTQHARLEHTVLVPGRIHEVALHYEAGRLALINMHPHGIPAAASARVKRRLQALHVEQRSDPTSLGVVVMGDYNVAAVEPVRFPTNAHRLVVEGLS